MIRAGMVALALGFAFVRIAPAAAQGIDFADQQNAPIEIYADSGLELSQDAKTVIARGNARAVRGRVTVTADTLIAHYRPKAGAGAAAPTPAAAKQGLNGPTGDTSEVWRLEADGHVKIFTATQAAYGDHGDYNIDDAVVVLTGKDLRMTTPTETVTARDSLEYWDKRQQAVARGHALAVKGEKRLAADVLVADYGQDREKRTVLRHATGFDHVVMTSPTEVATGNRGDYDPQTGIVILTGSVKLTRGENQLDGGYAVVNLNTGISRLYPTAPGATGESDQRVRGLLVPNHQNNQGAAPPAQSPPGAQ